MMARSRSWLAAAAAVVGMLGCAPFAVRTDFDPIVPFDNLKTYAWVDSAPIRRDSLRNASPFLEQRLRRAVDGVLEDRGFRLAATGDRADFLVSALVVGPSRAERGRRLWASYRCPPFSRWSMTFGYPYGFSRRVPWYRYRDYYRWDPWGYACSYRLGFGYLWLPIYDRPGDGLHGTLVIDMLDRQSKELMWRGSAEGALFEQEAGGSQAELDEIVAKVLRGFPPRGPDD
jgi:Domain of unknown function (DUF4136)